MTFSRFTSLDALSTVLGVGSQLTVKMRSKCVHQTLAESPQQAAEDIICRRRVIYVDGVKSESFRRQPCVSVCERDPAISGFFFS